MAVVKRTSVMVVDDHPIVRNGLCDMLRDLDDYTVVGQAKDGVEAVTLAEDLRPDIIIMDVLMPNKDGVDACREIIDFLPGAKVLMLTASTEEQAVVEAFAAGAMGYLLKDSGRDELLETLRGVAAGRLRIPLEDLRRAIRATRGGSQPSSQRRAVSLTSGEREVLTQFAMGRSFAQIAQEKGTSPVTVRNTIYRVQDKLGGGTRQEIVVWAVRNGLLDD